MSRWWKGRVGTDSRLFKLKLVHRCLQTDCCQQCETTDVEENKNILGDFKPVSQIILELQYAHTVLIVLLQRSLSSTFLMAFNIFSTTAATFVDQQTLNLLSMAKENEETLYGYLRRNRSRDERFSEEKTILEVKATIALLFRSSLTTLLLR